MFSCVWKGPMIKAGEGSAVVTGARWIPTWKLNEDTLEDSCDAYVDGGPTFARVKATKIRRYLGN